jgi:hypothetical protein
LRSKKEANGRKWLVWHKKTGKTAKAAKPLPPPTSHYSSTPQQECQNKSLKGEVQVHSHHTIHLSPRIHSHSIHPSIHHSTKTFLLHSPTPNFSTFFLYSSIETRSNLRLDEEREELHHESHELPQEPQEHKMNIAPRI